MKKGGLILLCLALFLLCVGGAGAYLYLTPRGLLHPDLPQDVMQRYMDSRSAADWRADYVRLEAPETGEFEDSETVAGHIFDALTASAPLTFREEPVADPEARAAYLVSAGEADLLRVTLRYRDGTWAAADTEPLRAVLAERRTISITAPSDARVTVNGVPLSESYITDPMVVYEDMTATELRFSAYPHRVRYTVPGLYEAPEVAVVCADGTKPVCLRADGSVYDYLPADAGAYTFTAEAPQDAVLTLNGGELTTADAAATRAFDTRLDIPEELQAYLPAYSIYSLGGLYSRDITASARQNGRELTAEKDENGMLRFAWPEEEALYDQCHERVETFLRYLCEYGAGHTLRYNPSGFIAPDSQMMAYIRNAGGSLIWTVNVTLTFEEITSGGYIPLGEDAFYCRGEVKANTSTYYQKKDLHLGYEMLWIRQNGSWMLQDLAFTEV